MSNLDGNDTLFSIKWVVVAGGICPVRTCLVAFVLCCHCCQWCFAHTSCFGSHKRAWTVVSVKVHVNLVMEMTTLLVY